MKTIHFFIVMGISGSGKTSVGKSLAAHLGWDFYDADDFHPQANIEKWQRYFAFCDRNFAGCNQIDGVYEVLCYV